MGTNKTSRAFILGLFVFIGLIIFVITVLTLGGQRKTFQKSVVVKAVFDDISGLQKGNNVWFSGVKIGTIKKISFYGNSQVLVEMSIDESSTEYIRKNAKARISSEGLIGNRIVVIYPGAAKSSAIQEGDIIGTEKAVNPDEMMNTFQANNQNLLAITNNVKTLTQQIADGKGSVGKILADESLYTEIQSIMASLKTSALNAQKLSNDLTAYTSKLNDKGTLANDLVTDTTLMSSLKLTISRMQEASANANQIINNLNTTTNNLNSSLKDTKTPAGMMLNDTKVAADIKEMLQTLKAASIKLDEDLEAAQHNFLLRGYFKKKAKAEEEANKKE